MNRLAKEEIEMKTADKVLAMHKKPLDAFGM